MLQFIGQTTLSFFQNIGKIVFFLIDAIKAPFHCFYVRQFITQFRLIGINTLNLIAATSLFTGMVLIYQTYSSFERYIGQAASEAAMANVLAISIIRELAPVITALMFSARSGSKIASELSTMRGSEQIDALMTLSISPLSFLIFPRLLAGVLALPLLVMVSNVFGILGGYITSVYYLDLNGYNLLQHVFHYMCAQDVFFGLTKAFVFGFTTSLLACYYGFYSFYGAKGVGYATIRAVVHSSFLILLFNYILTVIFFQ